MTISPKRIERLWEACPELRPNHMAYSYGSIRWVISVNGMMHGATIILEDIAHALIRDKIVWWLAASRISHGVHIENERRRKGKEYSVSAVDLYDRDDVTYDTVSCNDPTLACILAAERFLGLPEWKD